jgi:diguanylate cyclase (GGDEF)-like protein
VVVLGAVLLAASFYLLGFRPLAEQLRESHMRQITHFLETGSWLVHEVLDRHRGLAEQSASRTAIRKKLIEYNAGRIGLAELVEFSQPKLADAARANAEILGITRFDIRGLPVFTVGEALPTTPDPETVLDLPETTVIGPLDAPGGPQLIYYNPIFDPEHGQVGVDALLMDAQALQAIVEDDGDGFGHLALSAQGQLIFWTEKPGVAAAEQALRAFFASSESDPAYIVMGRMIEGVPWSIYVVVERDRFFAAIDRRLMLALSWVGVLTLAILLAMMLALRPIIRALLGQRRLYDQARRDPLTRLSNRSHFQEQLYRESVRARRNLQPFSLLLFDIDNFKRINDRYGHPQGDQVLRYLAEETTRGLRSSDFVARFGGEEFAVILPETREDEARALAERLRSRLEQVTVPSEGGTISVTVSVGVATFGARAGIDSKDDLVLAADRALYASKQAGRNRVTTVSELADMEPSPPPIPGEQQPDNPA